MKLFIDNLAACNHEIKLLHSEFYLPFVVFLLLDSNEYKSFPNKKRLMSTPLNKYSNQKRQIHFDENELLELVYTFPHLIHVYGLDLDHSI